MSQNPDWEDIPKFEFEIRGVDNSSIRFASQSVLAKRVASTGIVGFAATLTVCTDTSTFQHSFQFAYYNSLRRFRDGLLAIRNGTGMPVTLDGAGFCLTIGMHQAGVREGLMVEGYCSSIHDLSHTPWPKQSACEFALLNGSIGCIRFAFRSSLVDPPYLDNTIAGIDAIIGYLESEGFSP